MGYTAHGLPDGMSIDPATGRISGQPRETGKFTVTLGWTDPEASAGDCLDALDHVGLDTNGNVHTWADISPDVTLCGQAIRPGILTTYNPYGVTCPECIEQAVLEAGRIAGRLAATPQQDDVPA